MVFMTVAEIVPSVCPHDCPSACALAVERLAPDRIGRVHGAKDHPFTDGVVCAKVARYAERVHNPDRLTRPLVRVGAKGEGRFEPLSWDAALDLLAERFQSTADRHGPEAVWPYNYAGTMGLVQRDGIARLANLMGYSLQTGSICTGTADPGWLAGVGGKMGTSSLEIAEAEVIVLWGTNAVHTQVQVMTHVAKARKAHGAKVVVVDPYRNATAKQADVHLMLRPGTDGALACAVMHVLLRDGLADRDYLARLTDFGPATEAHLKDRKPEWAAAITGLTAAEIEAFARLYGSTKKSYIRFGYGFTRQRNGAAAMHAASCLPAVTGAWGVRGGGGLYSYSGGYHIDDRLITAADAPRRGQRGLDMVRIGRVLTNDPAELAGGPPVHAMMIQNMNPAMVAPEHRTVKAGLSRDDLFLCVHEQVMTETAKYADLVLPATMFLEHADVYKAGGHTFLQVHQPVITAAGECRENHWVVNELLKRLGADHPTLHMTAWEVVDATLRASGWPGAEEVLAQGGIDVSVRNDHGPGGCFHDGFPQADGRFRFHPDWTKLGPLGGALPAAPDHVAILDELSDERPFRLVTAPARNFLNSSFSETPTSRKQEKRPTVKIHPLDAAEYGVADGAVVVLGNRRGEVPLHAEVFDGVQRGILIVESIWPNADFEGGEGINTLTSAEPPPPAGGGAFHDTTVWLRAAS
ncbi:Anaerobic selenocysteine-containing dehydrogenase [Caenispirillum bisanense]|uniref:Anaerobic selenocysteine-containing dehydrogenase n=2 Tax=Caenispirillum bisanense TaxID=414052 RepID=A0A286GT05_9PROT|nr:Anaerobic selenocysteine-containing dehydrogenase [Caenispirillum bisanense]